MHVKIGQRVLVNIWHGTMRVAEVVGVSSGDAEPMVMVMDRNGNRTILRGSTALYGVDPA